MFEMRFGISPLSLELIIENILKEKGLAGLTEFHFSDVVKGVAEAGYKHCEIIYDVFYIFPISIDEEEINRLKKIKKDYNITYSVHFPFISLELASPNTFIRKGSIQSITYAYNSLIELEKDIEVFVLHPTGEFIGDAMDFINIPEILPIATELFANTAIESINEIFDETSLKREKTAIENIIFPFEGTIKIIEECDVKLCIDTAHFLAGFSGKHDLLEIAESYLDLAIEIHLQDYNKENPLIEHSALGTGNFPPKFLEILHETKFKGPIVFELLQEEAYESIEYIKKRFPQIKVLQIKNTPFY